jgi:hypothetical protein
VPFIPEVKISFRSRFISFDDSLSGNLVNYRKTDSSTYCIVDTECVVYLPRGY